MIPRKQRLNRFITKLIQDGDVVIVSESSDDSSELTIGVLPPDIPPVPPRRDIIKRVRIRPQRYFKVMDTIQIKDAKGMPITLGITKKRRVTRAQIKTMTRMKP